MESVDGLKDGLKVGVTTSPAPRQHRITVVLQHHFEAEGQDATTGRAAFALMLDSEESPYVRKPLKIKDDSSIEFGWVDVPGYLLIENRTDQFRSTLPTEEEKKETETKILYVEMRRGPVGGPQGIEIPPGEFAFFKPIQGTEMKFTSPSGHQLVVNLTVYPR